MMLPKDLLADLESGDRTSEHLENRETPTVASLTMEQFTSLQNALSNTTQFLSYRPGAIGGLQQLSGQQLGGITRW